MKRVWRRLDVRLFASYVLLAIVVVVALSVTLNVVAPSRFDEEYQSVAHSGEEEEEGHTLFVDTLQSSLPVTLGVTLLAAAIVSVLVARRIAAPVRRIRDATRRLAAGHYDERVAEPGELELAELARDVNRLAVELETTERRRARLISEVAHEMRTPLATMEGYVEGLLDEVFEPTEEVLTAIGEEAARLQRLAGDLAELSRAEEGAIALDLRTVDLGELTAACAERLRPQYDDKGVDLELLPGPRLLVQVDPERVTQVLTNLLGNALTYTDTGGRVTVTTAPRGDIASVAIADTGVGLDANELELVFDRFYRVPGPIRPSGGSGIGLTIARGIAHAHHGTIEAASPGLGRGSTFTLTIPLAEDDASAT